MKRLLALICLALATAPFAARAEGGTYTGHVMIGVGSPLSAGELENTILFGCDPTDPLNGLDNSMIALDEADRGRPGTLDATSGATGMEDFDVYFYDAACSYLDGTGWAAEGHDAGTVPENAAFAAVNLFFGADADFSLKITRA